MNQVKVQDVDLGHHVVIGEIKPHYHHNPMKIKPTLAATALAVISTTSALTISTQAQAAEECHRNCDVSRSVRNSNQRIIHPNYRVGFDIGPIGREPWWVRPWWQ